MWEINNLHQWCTFGMSLVVGLLCCIIYDVFRLDRQIFKREKLTVFFQDILLWLIYTFIIFSFILIRTNGEPRLFVFFGNILGFLICRLTISRLIMRMFIPIKRLTFFLRRKYSHIVEGLSKWANKQLFVTKKR